jgi:hypothetical protein
MRFSFHESAVSGVTTLSEAKRKKSPAPKNRSAPPVLNDAGLPDADIDIPISQGINVEDERGLLTTCPKVNEIRTEVLRLLIQLSWQSAPD